MPSVAIVELFTLGVILSRVSQSTQLGLPTRQFRHKGAAMEEDLADPLLGNPTNIPSNSITVLPEMSEYNLKQEAVASGQSPRWNLAQYWLSPSL